MWISQGNCVSFNLIKNGASKGQPQDVVKLHEEIDTLKSTLAKFVGGIEYLNKLLRYNRCPTYKFVHGYEGEIYIHDEDIVVCYFCGKVGHMTSMCMNLPKDGVSNAFRTNKEGPKKIWVHKDKIIVVVDILDSRKETPIIVTPSTPHIYTNKE